MIQVASCQYVRLDIHNHNKERQRQIKSKQLLLCEYYLDHPVDGGFGPTVRSLARQREGLPCRYCVDIV